jgi:hypothetical protein
MTRRDPHHRRTWVIVTDGERALQRRVCETFDGVTLVLDLLHALEKLWKVAHALHPEGSREAETFVYQRTERLPGGQVDQVVKGLRLIITKRQLTGTKAKTLRDVASYYQRNRNRMHYDTYLANGWPIASGSVEGACKNLIRDRFERSGMRWTTETAEALLRLRAVHLSGDFDAYWKLPRRPRPAAAIPLLAGRPEVATPFSLVEGMMLQFDHALHKSCVAAHNSIDPAGVSPVLGVVRSAQVVISGASGGRPLGVKARKYKYPVASALWDRSRLVQGCEQPLGPQHQANRCSVVMVSHQEPPLGERSMPTVGNWERRARRRRAKASVCGEEIGRVHPQGSPAYGRWHQGKDRCLKVGKVWSPAKTRPYGKDLAYNRKTGNRREDSRLAAEAVVVMTARTTQPRSSEGPLGGRGRRRGEGWA